MEKQPFIDEAERLRNAHKQLHPHYKVKFSSEKKENLLIEVEILSMLTN